MVKIYRVWMAVALLWASAAQAKFDSTFECELALDGLVGLQVHPPSITGGPTFLLLPGAYRSLLTSDPAVASLIARGYGVVLFNFSVQPFSVHRQAESDQRLLREREVTLASLTEEAQAVSRFVQDRYGISDLIPVSLSYSGTVSEQLHGYPVIVETVPMTSASAQSPSLEAYKKWLRSTEWMNPFAGPQITRQMLDAAYRMEWNLTLAHLGHKYQIPWSLRPLLMEGYLKLSHAAEDFEIDLARLDRRTFRVFILASGEKGDLLRHQIATILEMKRLGLPVATVIVDEATHLLPLDQPELYADTLAAVASGRIQPNSFTVLKRNQLAVTVDGPSASRALHALFSK